MELFNFIFRMGVLFAVYRFVWWLFDFLISFMGFEKKRSLWEHYIVMAANYMILADVSYLFCLDLKNKLLTNQQIITGGLILFTYYLGRLQRAQSNLVLIQFVGKNLSEKKPFHLRSEIIIMLLGLLTFTVCIFFSPLAFNPISEWFLSTIKIIEKLPILGFFFKLIGFFFLVSVLMKFLNGLIMLLTGQLFLKINSSVRYSTDKKNDEEFEEYEEMKDE